MTIIAVAVTLALLAGATYALLKANEEKKAEDRKFEARMKAHLGQPVNWPPPPVGPKGFGQGRGKRAA